MRIPSGNRLAPRGSAFFQKPICLSPIDELNFPAGNLVVAAIEQGPQLSSLSEIARDRVLYQLAGGTTGFGNPDCSTFAASTGSRRSSILKA